LGASDEDAFLSKASIHHNHLVFGHYWRPRHNNPSMEILDPIEENIPEITVRLLSC
jgi:hypothetical protein